LGEQLGGKHHIVEEDIENGTDMLHHIEVYQCPEKQGMEPGKVVCNFYREKGKQDVTNFVNKSCPTVQKLIITIQVNKLVSPILDLDSN
jgi:hypothetical protein